MEIKNKFAYILMVLILLAVFVIYFFNLVPTVADKFTFFLLSLIFVALVLPTVGYIKFFDLIEIKKQIKELNVMVSKSLGKKR